MGTVGFVVSIFAIAISCGAVIYYRAETSRIQVNLQNVLSTLSQQQVELLDVVAQQQGSALQKVIEKQSAVNKTYKAHIEQVLDTLKWHSKILNFNDSIPEVVPSFNEALASKPEEEPKE